MRLSATTPLVYDASTSSLPLRIASAFRLHERRFVVSILATLLCGLFASSRCVSAATISNDRIVTVVAAMGHDPRWVYGQYGRPSAVTRLRRCCSFAGFTNVSTLVDSYDLQGGGRIGFVYAQPLDTPESWTVVGVVYDSLAGPDDATIRELMGGHELRGAREFQCYDDDFVHNEPSPGKPSLSAYAVWRADHGRIVFAKFTINSPPKDYDPVIGKDILAPLATMDDFPMVQFGYFQSPREVMDLHIAPNDDVSIVTAHKQCFKYRSSVFYAL
jgi:hypothetical protein